MRILVLLRQILDPRGLMVNRRAGKVFVNREVYIINPADRGALELALRLRDADLKLNGSGQGLEVAAMALGPERVESVLRDALALGASRVIRVEDEALEAPAPGVTARAMRAVGEYLGECPVYLLGEEALDTGDRQTGPRLSAALDCPLVSAAAAASLHGGSLQVQRHAGGALETVEVDLPAVVTIRPYAIKPRYAHGGQILNAYRQGRVEVKSAADLQLSLEELQPAVEQRGPDFPPERELGTVIDGPMEYALEQMAAVLKRYRR